MPDVRSTLSSLSLLSARHITHERGGRRVLHDVSLLVSAPSCVGVVGPNGVGKSTLLQILAGELIPDEGSIAREPPTSTVGYLAQEQARDDSETVRQLLARRTGVRAAERRLADAGADLAIGARDAAERYDRALSHFDAVGAATFDARAEALLAEFGVTSLIDRPTRSLSGGQEAKIALASVELSQFDVVLLDEPTNDLDFEGLARLERWVRARVGATVIVSHDRDFLERTVTSVVELDEHTRTAVQFGGGWAAYQTERRNERRRAEERFEQYQERRRQLTERAQQQRQWAVSGVRREKTHPRDNDKAQRDFRIDRTEALAHKARQSERALDNLVPVEKPFEGWDLRFTINSSERAGAIVARLHEALVVRGEFRLGPLSLDIGWGDRVALHGVNGAGKSTLVNALLGEIALDAGERWLGPSVVLGVLGQDRRALGGDLDLVRYVSDTCALTIADTRSLLAKFGLSAQHVTRPSRLLSPGERTRAELAIFQGRGVNFLVLDEPTNHLDLPAIEQLEVALNTYSGTMLLVSHDRRLLDTVHVSRSLTVVDGLVRESSSLR